MCTPALASHQLYILPINMYSKYACVQCTHDVTDEFLHNTCISSDTGMHMLVHTQILDIEPVRGAGAVAAQGCVLAEAEVARTSDLGSNDDTFTVTTHLGHLLQPVCVVIL